MRIVLLPASSIAFSTSRGRMLLGEGNTEATVGRRGFPRRFLLLTRVHLGDKLSTSSPAMGRHSWKQVVFVEAVR